MPQAPALPLSAAEFSQAQDRRVRARLFSRYARALAGSGGRPDEAMAKVRARYPQAQQLDALQRAMMIRAGVPAMGSGNSGLVGADAFGSAFLDEAKPFSVFGQLAVTEVPSRTLVPVGTSNAVAGYVSEGRGTPVFRGSFASTSLSHDPKLGLVVVVTQELLDSAHPAAETMFQSLLTNGIIRGSDAAFLDPTRAAGVDTPASVTHAAPTIPSTGGDAEAVAADLGALSAALTTAGLPYTGRSYIASPKGGEYLGSLRYASGAPAFPGVGAAGGSILGVPLVTSDMCGDQVVLVHAPSILVSDDGIAITATRNGALEMSDTPIGDGLVPTGAPQVVSLMQTNCAALMAIRWLNFVVGRPGAVQVLSGFGYSVGVPPVSARRAAA